MIVFISAF